MNTEMSAREEEYVKQLEGLGTGELASLRRGCGERDPVEGRCPWLIGMIRGVAPEPAAFLVAGLLAQYSTADIKAGRHRASGDFGCTWKAAISGNDSTSIRRRFHILLDADFDPWTGEGDLPYRLRQMVRYAVGKGVGVDWPLLLTHVKFWNQPDKWVQKRWARSFFAVEDASASETSEIKE
ncbi:MAG: type I-E CRISPR-associated protein Cse2/CasB [Thermoleophilia bacterium]|jgi:CRISPR type I-E-associated protein CasB/Cse2